MRLTTTFVLLLAVLVTAGTSVRADEREIYRRVDLTEVRTGIIEIRERLGPRLDVPFRCEDRRGWCTQEVRFQRLFSMHFRTELRTSQNCESRIEHEDRGWLHLALQIEPGEDEKFLDRLRTELSSLGADAFAEPWAGIHGQTQSENSVLGEISRLSPTPSWGCLLDGEEGSLLGYSREVEEQPDGTEIVRSVGTATYRLNENNRILCEQMDQAVRDIQPDEIRTLPVPRALRETAVISSVSNSLPESAIASDMAPLPDGAGFTRRRNPGAVSGRHYGGPAEGAKSVCMRTIDEVQWWAGTTPAEISTQYVMENAWLARWIVETAERALGPSPTEQYAESMQFTMALIPTVPAVRLDGDDQPQETSPNAVHAIRLDEVSFLDEIGRRLDSVAEIDFESMERVITTDPIGFESEGWILVLCRPDGTAYYGLLPTECHSALLNADLFCAAVEKELE